MEVSLLSQQEEKFALFVDNILRHGKALSSNDLGDLQHEAAHSNHGDKLNEATTNCRDDKQHISINSNYGNSQHRVLFSNLGIREKVTDDDHGEKQQEGTVIGLEQSKKNSNIKTGMDSRNDTQAPKGGSNINVKEALFKKLLKDREKKYGMSSQGSLDDKRNEQPQEPIHDHCYISVPQSCNKVKVERNFNVEDTHNINDGGNQDEDMSEDSKDVLQNIDEKDDTSHDSLKKMDDISQDSLQKMDGISHVSVQEMEDNSQDSMQKMEEASLDNEQDDDDGSVGAMHHSVEAETTVKQGADTADLQSQQLKKKRGQMHYKCNICGYATNSYKLHKKHKNSHKEPQHITRAVTQSSRKEESTKKKEIPEKKKKTTITRSVIKSKPVVMIPERKLKCDKCQFRTDSEEKLKRHMAVHQSPESFVCGICDFKCRTKTGLGRHLKKHREQMPWICQICHYQAHDEFSLDLHMKSHNTGEAKESNVIEKIEKVVKKQRFKCDVCDFSTTNEEAFQKHWGKHTGEKYYKCDECIFGTNNKSVFLSHQRLHLGAKPYQCPTCGSRFTQMRGLKTHQNSNLCTPASGQKAFNQTVKITKNTAKVVEWAKAMISKKDTTTTSGDTKPGLYKCNQCEFTTNRPSHLSRHIIIHLDAKPFKCELCDYRANFKINLTTHMKIHSGEKPNKCEFCSYSTYREDHLRRHLATHKELTGTQVYHCDVCEYKTVTEHKLVEHNKKHQEIDFMDDVNAMSDESEDEDGEVEEVEEEEEEEEEEELM